ncbi:MAG: PAS domain-containing protein, partial [Nitrospirota bacterium]|nr:PAS domain-containing protein [Nitrospirota bacterium]
RKRAGEALKDSEERLRALGNALPDIAFILDEHGRYIDILAQPQKEKLLYADMSALKGRLLHDVLPKKSADLFLSVVRRTLETRESQTIEYVLDVQAGTRWFEGRTAPLHISGKDNMVMWVSREITDRKAAQEMLRESEEKYKALLANINEIVYTIRFENENSLTAKVEFVSDKVKDIIGFHPAEFYEQNELWFQLIHPDDVPAVIQSTTMLVSGKHPVTRTYRLKKKGMDEYLWVDDNMVPRFDEQGRIIGIYGVARDISERKRFEEHLKKYSSELEAEVRQRTAELEEKTIQSEAANMAKSEFLSNMSHELKTPLNAIIGFSELMKNGDAGALNDEQGDYVKDLWESGMHLNRIIDSLLDLMEIDSNKVELELSEFPLKQAIEKVLGRFSGKAERQGISISADIPDDVGPIVADQQKIQQVVQHLLGNAFKF